LNVGNLGEYLRKQFINQGGQIIDGEVVRVNYEKNNEKVIHYLLGLLSFF